MLNVLNLAGCVSSYLTVLGVLKLSSFLARHEAIITNSPKSKVLCDLYGRLSLSFRSSGMQEPF